MREILFKAKRLYNGQWVEGYPFPSRPGGELDRMIVFEGLPGGSTMSVVEIDPATVCQYAGEVGEKKVRLFEGDVVNVPGFTDGLCKDAKHYEIEVVGNIHDKEGV